MTTYMIRAYTDLDRGELGEFFQCDAAADAEPRDVVNYLLNHTGAAYDDLAAVWIDNKLWFSREKDAAGVWCEIHAARMVAMDDLRHPDDDTPPDPDDLIADDCLPAEALGYTLSFQGASGDWFGDSGDALFDDAAAASRFVRDGLHTRLDAYRNATA